MKPFYSSDNWKLLIPNHQTGIIEFRPEGVKVKKGKEISYNRSLAKHLDKAWQEKEEGSRKKGYVLINNPLVRYYGHSIDASGLTLEIAESDYKEFMGTNVFLGEGGKLDLPSEQRSNPLGVLSTILTEDDSTIVSLRSGKVASYKGGYYSLFGRGLSNCQDLLDRRTSVFNFVRNAIEEELKLNPEYVQEPVLVGLNHSLLGFGDYAEYMLLFKTEINETVKEVMLRKDEIIGEKRKYEDIKIISLTDEGKELENFLNERHHSFVATGEPALILLGREKFGEEWVDNLIHVKQG